MAFSKSTNSYSGSNYNNPNSSGSKKTNYSSQADNVFEGVDPNEVSKLMEEGRIDNIKFINVNERFKGHSVQTESKTDSEHHFFSAPLLYNASLAILCALLAYMLFMHVRGLLALRFFAAPFILLLASAASFVVAYFGYDTPLTSIGVIDLLFYIILLLWFLYQLIARSDQ